jgi:hypothetical protein
MPGKILRVALRPEVALSCGMSHPAGYFATFIFDTCKKIREKKWDPKIKIMGAIFFWGVIKYIYLGDVAFPLKMSHSKT